MATHINIEKLRQGLKDLKPVDPGPEKYSKMHRILLSIDLDNIDYSSFEEEDVRRILEFYDEENDTVIETLEEGLKDAAFLVIGLSKTLPGGNANVGFF